MAGFRVDAVPFVIETTVPGEEQGKQHFEYLAEFRRLPAVARRRRHPAGRGERAARGYPAVLRRRRAGDGLHLMFNFWVNQHLFYALATARRGAAGEGAARHPRHPGSRRSGRNFLRNHDELDLGPADRRAAPGGVRALRARGGHAALRPRHPPAAGADAGRPAAGGAGLEPPLLAARHAGDPLRRRDRDGRRPQPDERDAVRTPMQWSDEPNGGLLHARRRPFHPVIDGGVWATSASTWRRSAATRTRSSTGRRG